VVVVMQGTRVGSYDPTNGGFTTMFFAVASAVIGGTALLGGSGTVAGAFLGALLLGIVFGRHPGGGHQQELRPRHRARRPHPARAARRDPRAHRGQRVPASRH